MNQRTSTRVAYDGMFEENCMYCKYLHSVDLVYIPNVPCAARVVCELPTMHWRRAGSRKFICRNMIPKD